MINIQKIAEFLLERRHRASPVVLSGEILEAITSDGLQEALMRRWVVPDADTGNLTVTSFPGHVAEMEEIAKTPYKPEVIPESGAADIVLGHARRSRIEEISAPATGKPAPSMIPAAATPTPTSPVPSAPAATPTAPPAQATAAPAGAAAPPAGDKPLQIGDDVVVEEGRRAYRGRVSGTGDKIRVAFGAERPTRSEFTRGEVRLAPSDAPAQG